MVPTRTISKAEKKREERNQHSGPGAGNKQPERVHADSSMGPCAGAGVWWRSRHSHGGSTLYMGVQLPTDTEQCDPSQDGSWQELSKAGMHMPV